MTKDRTAVRLLGDLVRPTGKIAGPAPSVVLQGLITEERRMPKNRAVQVPGTIVVPAPGQTTTVLMDVLPAPHDWADVQPRKMNLTVNDGTTVLAQNVPVPGRQDLIVQKRRCTLVSTLQKDKDNKEQVSINMIAAGRPN